MKIRLLIALLIASVTITSCNDFLTEKEYDFTQLYTLMY